MQRIKIFSRLKQAVSPQQSKDIGSYAEEIATRYLKQQNIRVITKNFLCKLGEIDIIGTDNNTIIFFEVRYRKNHKHGSAAQSITYTKQKKVINTAQFWLKIHGYRNVNIRFDAILFDRHIDHQHLTWLKAAF
ncbi:YraN family protein [Marinomonas agarivorans]|nr:YraN family protein [Marinomonas agarivorans]